MDAEVFVMRAVVVYESMYGNTRRIADAIGRGLARGGTVSVLPVAGADRGALQGADLLVVGGPTHVHGLSRASTRKAAVEQRKDDGLMIDPGAYGPGLREWFPSLAGAAIRSAAFDTRVAGPPAVTGRASKRIAKELRGQGCPPVTEPESFLVDKTSRLKPGEEERAEAWGAELAAAAQRAAKGAA
jgi:flavodoxin